MKFAIFFFLTAIWLSLGQLRAILYSGEDSVTNPMLIFLQFRPDGHHEPRNEVVSLSLAERLVGFEPGTSRFSLQRLTH